LDRENVALLSLCGAILLLAGVAAVVVVRPRPSLPQPPVATPPPPGMPGPAAGAAGGAATSRLAEATRRVDESPTDPAAYLARAAIHAQEGDRESALADLDTALVLDPGNHEMLRARTRLHGQMGDDQGLIQDYTALLALEPDSEPHHASRARARARSGDLKGAIDDWTRAIELAGGDALTYRDHRAALRHRQGDHAGAIEDYDLIIDRGRGESRHHAARGQCRFALHDYAGAEEDQSRALERGRGNASVLIDRARTRQARGDLQKALADADAAVSAPGPARVSGLGMRAAILADLERFDEAIADVDAALAAGPSLSFLHHRRGWIHWAAGDLEAAAADFRNGITYGTDAMHGRMALGIVQYHMGRWREARDELEAAGSGAAANATYAQLYLFLARERSGQQERACEGLARFAAARSGPDGDWPGAIIGFLLGSRSQEELLAAAEAPARQPSAQRLCEAFFYAGSVRLVTGDEAGAAELFRRSVGTGERRFYEYHSARTELRSLAGTPARSPHDPPAEAPPGSPGEGPPGSTPRQP
jgi:tetratricopeptide (TPR) repeat protein